LTRQFGIPAREFMAVLKATSADLDQKIGGRSLNEWLAQADEKIGCDPVAQGVEAVDQVTEWINEIEVSAPRPEHHSAWNCC